MKISKHEINKAQWQELIREQSESGLSIREWCRRHNMSHGKFYYWQRVIREGLGTEFLNHIIHYCLTKGYRYLHTDTAINNKIAQNFYIRNGFIDKGITRSYICRG